MQGGFIGGFKENLKALKQEIKGADVFDGQVKFPENQINNKEFVIESKIYDKDFMLNSEIHEKELGIKTKIYFLKDTKIIPQIKAYKFGMTVDTQNYMFIKPETIVKSKNLEKFITVTRAKTIELTKKAKIKNGFVDRFKVRTFEGTDKIRKIPAIIEGRRFVSNKELIELAVKVKTERKDLNFTKFNFKAVFENLPYDLIDDYQYLDDSVQLKIHYKKYTREECERKKLVVLVEKNSLIIEKIFV